MRATKQNSQPQDVTGTNASARALAISSAITAIGFAAFGLFLALFLGSQDLQWMMAFLLLAMASLSVAWTATRVLLQTWRRAGDRNVSQRPLVEGAAQVRDG